jgi:lysophospholipase L1-like esterase
VTLSQPKPLHLQRSDMTTLTVSAAACVSAGQGVRFVIDGATGMDDYTAPYSQVFAAPAPGNHTVEAFLIDAGGSPVSGTATYDVATNVGVGDYYVAMGDGMTTGFGDNKADDDNSTDGRNMWGGFTPILGDLLTAAKGYPVNVVNEGVGGTSAGGSGVNDGVNIISTLLANHPNANYVMVMYGHNDAKIQTGLPNGRPSGSGLVSGQPGYAGSFKDKIQQIINAVKAAGKRPLLAKAPPIKPDAQYNVSLIPEYNTVMDELAADPANNVDFPPADFYTYFLNHPEEYAGSDTILMNGLGYQHMAEIWRNTLVP